MSRLERHQRDWQDLASLDPLWAIASTPEHRHGGWDDDEFMASGERKVDKLLRRLGRHGLPEHRHRALDFGCGVGRVTLPLADRFDHATGIDIAPAMIEQARERAVGRENVRYLLNDREDLEIVAGERFDLVYSSLVLQHLPSRAIALRYLSALAGLIAPGGVLVVQLPVGMTLRLRVQPGRRIYEALRALGVSRETLYRRLGLHPMRMTWAPRSQVDRCLEGAGLRIVEARERDREGVRSVTLYAAR